MTFFAFNHSIKVAARPVTAVLLANEADSANTAARITSCDTFLAYCFSSKDYVKFKIFKLFGSIFFEI